ncbi:MAG: hypothetical protein A2498_16725 [Lentisphaerae bacterium RIFOXYC12_FULL_60_16]|nr:MAG: hypothetical protein A2498_16725 [Lentisphaerae bacterium RIFOXYC12_FULL_60_16]OGV84478.1 MAG: hypothetical protein A2340_04080 [Lentisphaerae bacterium RIFOXYB12_FULL_60_10]
MKILQRILTHGLLAFALVTLGFAIGKETTRRSLAPHLSATGHPESGQAVNPKTDEHLMVYYLHATARCTTCTTIEQWVRTCLERRFPAELAAGRIRFQTADYQKDETLAKRLNVAAGGVVVVRRLGETELDHQSLDQIWRLLSDPPAFERYVGDAVQQALASFDRTEGTTR